MWIIAVFTVEFGVNAEHPGFGNSVAGFFK